MTSCAPTLGSVTSEGALHIGQAAFRPITWSLNDTVVTIRQIKVHNEVGVELGLWKKPTMRNPVKKPKPKTAAIVTLTQTSPVVQERLRQPDDQIRDTEQRVRNAK